MPAPGEQYNSSNIKNPFDERSVNAFTAQEIATLQCKLNQQLGPEFVSHRQGAAGTKVAYIEGTKAIALANEVFGFNGWSSSLQQVQIDYVDETPSGRVSLGLSIIVRVTLRDGTYHEDMGYGTIDNAKGKGAAFEKAKKEAATDGLKRALRNFGNVLGNCLYDKEYLKKISGLKAKPFKFDESKLHRHPDFAPPAVKTAPDSVEAAAPLMKTEHATAITSDEPVGVGLKRSSGSSSTLEGDDEFGGNLFDGMEISEHHGDETAFTTNGAPHVASAGSKPANGLNGTAAHRMGPAPTNGTAAPSLAQGQSMPTSRPSNNPIQPPQLNNGLDQGPGRTSQQTTPRGPQNANAQPTNHHADIQRPRGAPPTVDIHAPPKPAAQPQPQQNQHLRSTPPQGQQAASHRATVGFVSGRAADLAQKAETPINVPAFNPHVDSPLPAKLRTPGVDHKRSMGVTRESVGAPPRAPQLQASQQAQQAQGVRPAAGSRSGFVHPQQDASRKIGAPQGRAMTPVANRNAYKPPGMVGVKRPPLTDVSNQNGKAEGPESKRVKIDGPHPEHAGGTVTV